MKYIEIINRNNILSLVPAVGLNDEARAAITLNIVYYEQAISAFEEEMRKAADKLKNKGFDEKLDKFHLAIFPPEKPTEEQKKQIEELRADPAFEPFRKKYDEVNRQYNEVRNKAMQTRELEVCECPLMEHLPAISRVLPAGGKVTRLKDDGTIDYEIDNQQLYTLVAQVAVNQK